MTTHNTQYNIINNTQHINKNKQIPIINQQQQLMLSLLTELIISSLIHQSLQLIRIRQLTINTHKTNNHLKLHEPTLLHRRLVHERRSLRKSLVINHTHTNNTVFTSITLPEAGQKASEAAFTDSTEENESLHNHKQNTNIPSVDLTSNLRKLNVNNISKRMLSIISDSNSSRLASSELYFNSHTQSYLNPLVILREISSERTSSKSARRKKSLRSESIRHK